MLAYWDAKLEEFVCPYMNEKECPYPEVIDCDECPIWNDIMEDKDEQ